MVSSPERSTFNIYLWDKDLRCGISFMRKGETIDRDELTPKEEKNRLPEMNRMKHEQSRYLFTEGLFQLSLAREFSLSSVTPSS